MVNGLYYSIQPNIIKKSNPTKNLTLLVIFFLLITFLTLLLILSQLIRFLNWILKKNDFQLLRARIVDG